MKSLKKIFYITLLSSAVIFAMGCQHAINAPPSQHYLDGLRIGDLYAKKDALNYKCMEHSFFFNVRTRGNIQQHIRKFKQEKAPADFINGFSQSYQTAYRDYIDAYCDDID